MTALRVVVMADTHLRSGPAGPPGPGRIPAGVWEMLSGADAVLHAGDVVDGGLLEVLGRYAPCHAVLGNNDGALAGTLPSTRELVLGGVRIAMIHDSGPSRGRAERMKRRFPDAAVVVFGHSHIPVDGEGVGGQVLFNPGSPTQRRAQPVHTVGELRLVDGRVSARRIVELEPPPDRRR